MKNIITLIMFLCTVCGFTAYCQPLPNTKEQYDFLQWYIKKGPLPALSDSLIQLESTSFRITSMEAPAARKFRIKDVEFFKKQLNDKTKFTRLDTILLPGASWKASGSATYPVSHISLPVFSRNRHVVMINHTYAENASTVTGGMEVYIRDKDGNWVW